MTATTTPPDAADALVRRSIEVIAEHQDAGGAYLASPTFPVYRFSWFRDGAFIADAMSRFGQRGSSDRFFAWCSRVINDRAHLIEELIDRSRSGHPIGRDEHLPTRYTVDGQPTGEDWWDFQLDGYGTWIVMLARHLRRAPDTAVAAPGVVVAVERCVDYLIEFWAEPCFDWWEEDVDGVHVSTLAAIESGLRHAAEANLVTAGRARSALEVARSVRRRVERDGVIDGHLIKTLGRGDRVDASLIAAFEPFGTFASTSPLATATYERIYADLAPDGVHRYLGDTYFGGGRWVVLAGFLGAFEAATGRTDDARRRRDWMTAQQAPNGALPEQVTDRALEPDRIDEWVRRWGPVATPLLWSHAMYLVLADELGRGVSHAS